MKYIVVLGDGMADEPIEALGGKTPLEYADTKMMDILSKKGETGMVHTIPDGMKPGSDTANLSVLGMIRNSIIQDVPRWRRCPSVCR